MSGDIPPPWQPRQRKIAHRNARLRRLMRNGTLAPQSKDELRALAASLAPHPARVIPSQGQPCTACGKPEARWKWCDHITCPHENT